MARTYHVLKRDEENSSKMFSRYDFITEIEASNPEQAIRLTAIDNGTGRYVAVPQGNWSEIGVRVEIPAPRVIFENEPQIGENEPLDIALASGETPLVDDAAIKLAGMILPPEEGKEDPLDISPMEAMSDDEAFQERKAELAARRAGQ